MECWAGDYPVSPAQRRLSPKHEDYPEFERRASGVPHDRQGRGIGVVQTGWMAKAVCTGAQHAAWVQHAAIGGWRDVENDVVRVGRITGHAAHRAANRPEMVEVEKMSNPPGDHVVGAGGVAADTDPTDFLAAGAQKDEPTAKNVYPANTLADQRVVRAAEQTRVPLVGGFSIDRVAVLQAIETAAGLDGRVQVGRGQRQTIGE